MHALPHNTHRTSFYIRLVGLDQIIIHTNVFAISWFRHTRCWWSKGSGCNKTKSTNYLCTFVPDSISEHRRQQHYSRTCRYLFGPSGCYCLPAQMPQKGWGRSDGLHAISNRTSLPACQIELFNIPVCTTTAFPPPEACSWETQHLPAICLWSLGPRSNQRGITGGVLVTMEFVCKI